MFHLFLLRTSAIHLNVGSLNEEYRIRFMFFSFYRM